LYSNTRSTRTELSCRNHYDATYIIIVMYYTVVRFEYWCAESVLIEVCGARPTHVAMN